MTSPGTTTSVASGLFSPEGHCPFGKVSFTLN
jgi:hypothetical protein